MNYAMCAAISFVVFLLSLFGAYLFPDWARAWQFLAWTSAVLFLSYLWSAIRGKR